MQAHTDTDIDTHALWREHTHTHTHTQRHTETHTHTHYLRFAAPFALRYMSVSS